MTFINNLNRYLVVTIILLFCIRYVYTPFMSQQRSFLVKFGCSILCFSFVAVFHGNRCFTDYYYSQSNLF